jgi:hypothetical protein
MGLFKKLTRSLRSGRADETELLKPLESLNRNNRLHPRYLLPGNGLATLRLPDGTVGTVMDLSYGGIAVVYDRAVTTDPARLSSNLEADLTLLDRSIVCRLTPSRMVPQSGDRVLVGFRVQHDTPDALLFLREFIEPMRCGQTLASLPQDFRKERYRSPDWACLRGDGPVDILVRTEGGGGKLAEALLTFKMNDTYCELTFVDGKLRTGHAIKSGEGGLMALGTQMSQSAAIDKAVLRHAIAVIVGAPPTLQSALAGVLTETLEALRESRVHAGAA